VKFILATQLMAEISVESMNFAVVFGIKKLESLGYRVALFCAILRPAIPVEQ